MSGKILRVIAAVAVALLAVGLVLVGYQLLILGTGLTGVLALLHHWQDAVFGFGSTESGKWMIIILAALVIASLVYCQTKDGRY